MKHRKITFITGILLVLVMSGSAWFWHANRQKAERQHLEKELTRLNTVLWDYSYAKNSRYFPRDFELLRLNGQIDEKTAQDWTIKIHVQEKVGPGWSKGSPVAWTAFDGKWLLICIGGDIKLVNDTELAALQRQFIALDD